MMFKAALFVWPTNEKWGSYLSAKQKVPPQIHVMSWVNVFKATMLTLFGEFHLKAKKLSVFLHVREQPNAQPCKTCFFYSYVYRDVWCMRIVTKYNASPWLHPKFSYTRMGGPTHGYKNSLVHAYYSDNDICVTSTLCIR